MKTDQERLHSAPSQHFLMGGRVFHPPHTTKASQVPELWDGDQEVSREETMTTHNETPVTVSIHFIRQMEPVYGYMRNELPPGMLLMINHIEGVGKIPAPVSQKIISATFDSIGITIDRGEGDEVLIHTQFYEKQVQRFGHMGQPFKVGGIMQLRQISGQVMTPKGKTHGFDSIGIGVWEVGECPCV